MFGRSLKSLLVAVFSVCMMFFYNASVAQDNDQSNGSGENTQKEAAGEEKKSVFDANEVIFGHVMDAHEFHFLSYEGKDGKEHEVSVPLPVILYSPQKGWSFFMYSAFHHGEEEADGYRLDSNKKIVPVDPGVKVYDLSPTRNVVQMFLAMIVLIWIMVSAAKKYKKVVSGHKAPSGMQNAMEVIITFVRDEVAKPNLGNKSDKYLPLLLTIFFFILINNIFGMIPGSANVSGNIAFTMLLSLVSFVVILVSSNKHYWGHIINPPVPWWVKPILIPVEILGIFTKPFALMIRLFANMLAGHIIIICLISLIFIFGALNVAVGWGFVPVSVAFVVFIYFIEILVAFIQAFIFASLTAVFVGQAVEETHHKGEHAEGYDDPIMI